jgi:hypothetical protein
LISARTIYPTEKVKLGVLPFTPSINNPGRPPSYTRLIMANLTSSTLSFHSLKAEEWSVISEDEGETPPTVKVDSRDLNTLPLNRKSKEAPAGDQYYRGQAYIRS